MNTYVQSQSMSSADRSKLWRGRTASTSDAGVAVATVVVVAFVVAVVAYVAGDRCNRRTPVRHCESYELRKEQMDPGIR